MTEPAASSAATPLALSQAFGERCRRFGWTCATAESCTGGGIAHLITLTAGASDYLQGGIIAYSNAVKHEMLGVTTYTLDSRGAVSAECAAEMAQGVLTNFGVDLAISSTGIAGPGGATARKPVGLVYIGVATAGQVATRELRLTGDRQAIMDAATVAAIELVLELTQPDPSDSDASATADDDRSR